MSSEKSLVRVTIAGEEYMLRAEATPEYTRECAKYVDSTIADFQRQSRTKLRDRRLGASLVSARVDLNRGARSNDPRRRENVCPDDPDPEHAVDVHM